MVIENQCPGRCDFKKSKLHVSINPTVVESSCSNVWLLRKSKSDLRLNAFSGRTKSVNPRIFDAPKFKPGTIKNKYSCKSNASQSNKSIQTIPIASNKSTFLENMQQNNSDSNCSLIVNLPNQPFVRKSCYYFEPQKKLNKMKVYKCKIRSNGEPHGIVNCNNCKCCNTACPAWKNRIMQEDSSDTSIDESPDVYRTILGPTPDESILAGLQTVIDMCGMLETPSQMIQTSGTSETESMIHYTDVQQNRYSIIREDREHYNISPPEPPKDIPQSNIISKLSRYSVDSSDENETAEFQPAEDRPFVEPPTESKHSLEVSTGSYHSIKYSPKSSPKASLAKSKSGISHKSTKETELIEDSHQKITESRGVLPIDGSPTLKRSFRSYGSRHSCTEPIPEEMFVPKQSVKSFGSKTSYNEALVEQQPSIKSRPSFSETIPEEIPKYPRTSKDYRKEPSYNEIIPEEISSPSIKSDKSRHSVVEETYEEILPFEDKKSYTEVIAGKSLTSRQTIKSTSSKRSYAEAIPEETLTSLSQLKHGSKPSSREGMSEAMLISSHTSRSHGSKHSSKGEISEAILTPSRTSKDHGSKPSSKERIPEEMLISSHTSRSRESKSSREDMPEAILKSPRASKDHGSKPSYGETKSQTFLPCPRSSQEYEETSNSKERIRESTLITTQPSKTRESKSSSKEKIQEENLTSQRPSLDYERKLLVSRPSIPSSGSHKSYVTKRSQTEDIPDSMIVHPRSNEGKNFEYKEKYEDITEKAVSRHKTPRLSFNESIIEEPVESSVKPEMIHQSTATPTKRRSEENESKGCRGKCCKCTHKIITCTKEFRKSRKNKKSKKRDLEEYGSEEKMFSSENGGSRKIMNVKSQTSKILKTDEETIINKESLEKNMQDLEDTDTEHTYTERRISSDSKNPEYKTSFNAQKEFLLNQFQENNNPQKLSNNQKSNNEVNLNNDSAFFHKNSSKINENYKLNKNVSKERKLHTQQDNISQTNGINGRNSILKNESKFEGENKEQINANKERRRKSHPENDSNDKTVTSENVYELSNYIPDEESSDSIYKVNENSKRKVTKSAKNSPNSKPKPKYEPEDDSEDSSSTSATYKCECKSSRTRDTRHELSEDFECNCSSSSENNSLDSYEKTKPSNETYMVLNESNNKRYPAVQLKEKEIRYAYTKITEFDEYITYEILQIPLHKPVGPNGIPEGVFVVKRKH